MANTLLHRRPIKRAVQSGGPAPGPDLIKALERHSAKALKEIAQAAQIKIPKTKGELIKRLAESQDVAVGVTTEVVAFRPRS